MIINTRDFGQVDIPGEEIYRFTQPLFGFEDYTEYVLLHDSDIGEDIVWLQSVQEPGLCFILMDPMKILPGYSPVLPEGSEKLLGVGDCYCMAVAVIPQNFRESTVNLKCPVFLNPATRQGAQIMIEGDYSVRYPLMKGGGA